MAAQIDKIDFYRKKSTFTKPPISLPLQHISPNAKRWNVVHIPQIYHLFLFFEFPQNGGTIQDGVLCKIFMKTWIFSGFALSTELNFGLIGWFLLLINLKILFSILDHPNIKLPYKFLLKSNFFCTASVL